MSWECQIARERGLDLHIPTVVCHSIMVLRQSFIQRDCIVGAGKHFTYVTHKAPIKSESLPRVCLL